MKKLYLAVLSVLCCFALATTAFADVIAGPEAWFSPRGGRLYILIAVIVLAVGLLIYKLLRNRKQ